MTQLMLFDYQQLDTETRVVVQQRTTEIKALMKRTAQDIIEIGEKLIEVKARLPHGAFGGWLESEFEWTSETARRFMNVADKFKNNKLLNLDVAPSALYLLAAPSTPDDARAEAISRAEAGERITHSTAKALVNGYKQPEPQEWQPTPASEPAYKVNVIGNLAHTDQYDDDMPEWLKDAPSPEAQEQQQKPEKRVNYITLDDWGEGVRGLGDPVTSAMNRVNENIEWASFSWNPVTGCLHNCAYCYARDIANRFYKQKFEPSFLPERLSQPANTKPIAPRWAGDTGYKNVFTCSMADLFGKWVPAEWIEAVLQTIADNPQWDFLLLTKFPVRMAEFDYPDNVWLGTSVDYQWAVDRAEKAFTKIKGSGFNGVCWISCEPMMERLTFNSLDMFDWVVMGGSSKSTKTSEYIPPFDDIAHLHQQARKSGCLVYQKTNLMPGISNNQRLREFPQ